MKGPSCLGVSLTIWDAALRRKAKVGVNRQGREEFVRSKKMQKAPPGFEPGIADLQSAALPLGEGADRDGFIGFALTELEPSVHF